MHIQGVYIPQVIIIQESLDHIILKTGIHSFVLSTNTFLSDIWKLSYWFPEFDFRSLISKIDNDTFGVSFFEVISQQNFYSVPNFWLIAINISFYIYKPFMVPLLYSKSYDYAISKLKISYMITNEYETVKSE